MLDIVSAKQEELYDADNQRLREHPIFSKDGEIVGYATASVSEIKALVESWQKTHAYLEGVSGEDVRKKQKANAAKPARQTVKATNAIVIGGDQKPSFWAGQSRQIESDEGDAFSGEGDEGWIPGNDD